MRAATLMMPDAVQRHRGAASREQCSAWLAAIDRRLARVDESDRAFVRESSSLRIGDIDGLDAIAVVDALRGSTLGVAIAARLGRRVLLATEQCWVRRQHAPSLRPPGAHPHAWHQDGALGHDFSRGVDADGGLLRMLTAWIALVPCGVQAPSLEWIAAAPARLLGIDELRDDAVQARHAAVAVRHAVLDAGDALLFDGTLLHRTSVHGGMTAVRTSIELRFFADVPARLAAQRFECVEPR